MESKAEKEREPKQKLFAGGINEYEIASSGTL